MIRTSLLVCALVLAASNARANLIENGGFETGTFSEWVAIPDPVDSLFFVSGRPHTGTYAAWFGAIGNVDETISQTFDTVAGDAYTVDFWLAHGRSWASNDFNVSWIDSSSTTSLFSIVDPLAFNYTHYSFTHTAEESSATILFGGRDVMSYFYLDDVSVTSQSVNLVVPVPVPEPSTLLLVGIGAAAFYRKRQRARS